MFKPFREGRLGSPFFVESQDYSIVGVGTAT